MSHRNKPHGKNTDALAILDAMLAGVNQIIPVLQHSLSLCREYARLAHDAPQQQQCQKEIVLYEQWLQKIQNEKTALSEMRGQYERGEVRDPLGAIDFSLVLAPPNGAELPYELPEQ